jgi:hypothetical protein
MNTYLNSLNVCVSELMFPALAAASNLNIQFVPSNQSYDYDVIIEGHPTQVKTLLSFNLFPTSQLEIQKQQIFFRDRAKDLHNRKQITWDAVKNEIISYVKDTGIDRIDEALRQGAEIIILDGTRTIPGLFLDFFYTDDYEYIKVQNSFAEIVTAPPPGFINVMFAATTYDTKFRISSLVVKVPVMNNKRVNEEEIDRIYT